MKRLTSTVVALCALAAHADPAPPAQRYTESCAGCHTPDPGAFFRHSALVRDAQESEVAALIRNGRPTRGMPSLAAAVDLPEALALAAWLKSQVAAWDARVVKVGQRVEAESLRVDRSAGFDITRDGAITFLQYVDRGSHLCYEDIDLTGARSLEYRYAKGPGEPPRRFAVVAFDGDFVGGRRIVLGEKITRLTDGWTQFRTERIGFSRELPGRFRLCIIGMDGGGVFNLDWFALSDVTASNDGITLNIDAGSTSLRAGGHAFELEKVGEIDGEFWSLDFLDTDTVIATQKRGSLWLFRKGQRLTPVAGLPAFGFIGQGGLLAVRAHPDYRRNGWIYLSFTEADGPRSALAIVRGRIRDGRWVDQQDIHRLGPGFFTAGGEHFGGRLTFDEKYLYFSIGDRGHQENAQKLDNPFGKIHRVFDDGRVPADNPFASTPGALPTIWSLGHRNPQGLFHDARTRALWSTEHGPKGGDELNLIHRGRNYGWPLATHGINYDGTEVSPYTEREGMESPLRHWSPSAGLSNLTMYDGGAFPRWRQHLLVSTLAHQQLKLIRLDGQRVMGEETLMDGLGRIRDVVVGPDGLPYVALNQPNGQIYRLVPADQPVTGPDAPSDLPRATCTSSR